MRNTGGISYKSDDMKLKNMTVMFTMATLTAFAQDGHVKVGFDLSALPDCKDFNIAVAVAGSNNQSVILKDRVDGEDCKVAGEIPVSPTGIYNIYAYNKNQQYSIPAVIDPRGNNSAIGVSLEDGMLHTNLTGQSNKALNAVNEQFIKVWIRLGSEMDKLDAEELRKLISRYPAVADSVANTLPADEPVGQYIRLWGYVMTSDMISMANYLRARAGKDVPFSLWDILSDPVATLDNDMSGCFRNSNGIVVASLKGNGIKERMADLYSKYSNRGVRERAADSMLESFLTRFDYNKFDEGLALVTTFTEKYGLPESWIKQFVGRRATLRGAAFPADVKLEDKDGNPVDFSMFKGKYVYIDLWASWCGPCVKEIPHLKMVEKEMEGNDDVVFVSISVDQNKDAWLKKMNQLDLHGYQLHDVSGQLCNLLNVTGIPHFMIYDKDGGLHTYKAPRPSSEDTVPLLKSLK